MSEEGIIRVVARWQAAPGAEDEVREILRELAQTSELEAGCVSFTVLEAAETPGLFELLEQYAGAAARHRHLDSAHFERLVLHRAVPLLTLRDVRVFTTVHIGSRQTGRNMV